MRQPCLGDHVPKALTGGDQVDGERKSKQCIQCRTQALFAEEGVVHRIELDPYADPRGGWILSETKYLQTNGPRAYRCVRTTKGKAG